MIIMIRSIILLRRRICTLLRPRWLGNVVDDAYTLWSENHKKGQLSTPTPWLTLLLVLGKNRVNETIFPSTQRNILKIVGFQMFILFLRIHNKTCGLYLLWRNVDFHYLLFLLFESIIFFPQFLFQSFIPMCGVGNPWRGEALPQIFKCHFRAAG